MRRRAQVPQPAEDEKAHDNRAMACQCRLLDDLVAPTATADSDATANAQCRMGRPLDP